MVGLGWIADKHYYGIKNSRWARLGAVSDIDEDKLQRIGREWNVNAYRRVEDLLDEAQIEAVIVATPHHTHPELVMKSLESGKHVLCEKPLALQSKDAGKMKEYADKKGLVLMQAENFLYRPPLQEAKNIVRSGKLGRIVYAEFSLAYFLSRGLDKTWRKELRYSGGGTLMDSGIHQVNESVYLLGRPFRVFATMGRVLYQHMEGEDVALLNLVYQDESIAIIFMAWACADYSSTPEVKILGTDGACWISDALYFQEFTEEFRNSDFPFTPPPKQKIVEDIPYLEYFRPMVDHFCECIREGSKPISPAEDAEISVKIIEAAYKSAKSKHPVEV